MASVAAAQRGVVHRSQVLAVGISRRSIHHRLKVGSWHRVLPGVFAVGHPALERWGLETAALLSCGAGCVLSHATAAALWGLIAVEPPEVSVTIAGRDVRRSAPVHIHRVPAIDVRDVRLREGLPVTAPARTMIDFTGTASGREAEAALNEARVLQLVTDEELREAMDRCPLRPGVGRLRTLLAAEWGPAVTRSEAERQLRRLVERAELPRPQFNVWLHGYLVDALWSEAKVVLEVDGFDVHGRRRAFESDRRRDQRLAAEGFIVIRVTGRQLRDEPLAVLGRLAQALALALARGAP